MPEAAQRHGRQDCQDILRDRVARAGNADIGQRQEDIIPQEPRQRHMPTLPEHQNAGRSKWRVEVIGKPNSEKQRDPDGHIGITGKIEEDLESEAKASHADPSVTRRLGGGLVDRIDDMTDRIAERDFLDQAEDDEGNPQRTAPFPLWDRTPVDRIDGPLPTIGPEDPQPPEGKSRYKARIGLVGSTRRARAEDPLDT